MKLIVLILACMACVPWVQGQVAQPSPGQQHAIKQLIKQYSQARETNDTTLLKQILTTNVDQLVSNGEWRTGIRAAVDGMLASSKSSPGSRTLIVDKIRMLKPSTVLVDCRYTIVESAQSTRSMWSSFMVIRQKKRWKIAAIRNMLPARQ